MRKPFKETLSKESFQTYFYPYLVDLLNDEDNMVRMEAIETAI